jgi:putative transposase
LEGRTYEAFAIYRRTDFSGFQRARVGGEAGRFGAQAWDIGSHAVQLVGQIWRSDGVGSQAAEVAGGREQQAEKAVGRHHAGQRRAQGAAVKKLVRAAAKGEAVALLRSLFEMSERRACTVIAADRKMVRYRSRRPADTELRSRLRELANQRRRFGYRRLFINKSNRKQPFTFDRKSYKQRHRIENAFCRLKDFRRIATRYDRPARNFLASVYLVAAIVWWIL